MKKKDLETRSRQILASVRGNGFVSGQDEEFLKSLFENHPDRSEKIGATGYRIQVRHVPPRGDKAFFIVRDDGSVTDISFRKCIFAPATPRMLVVKACRTAVKESIEAFLSAVSFPCTCAVSGEGISCRGECDVDHYDMTFAEVVSAWLEKRGVTAEGLSKLVNHGRGDLNMTTSFSDHGIAEDFRAFHDANTHLRVVTKAVNSKLAADSRRRSSNG